MVQARVVAAMAALAPAPIDSTARGMLAELAAAVTQRRA
jgi:hypothetical protein